MILPGFNHSTGGVHVLPPQAIDYLKKSNKVLKGNQPSLSRGWFPGSIHSRFGQINWPGQLIWGVVNDPNDPTGF